MRLSTTLDHLGFPRFHHRGHGKVVIIDAPHEHHSDHARAGQERYRATSYSDPWPDRA